ncbi:leucine rich repeat containing 51 isoform X1 [Erpetoichthys calabaricus]|uniref:Leucine-rich repeat-containing protein 51 n=1 Tax=Erpetoichthys calabaricus TaxID=27687 RepID=A0A8C4RT86_ERPCA|nr:leucine rich repeat containing 51 isoform X1 [Erpetoichthys calabaricus]
MAEKSKNDPLYGPPLDLSFKCLNSVEEAMSEEPRAGLRPLLRSPEGKVCSRAVKLNNNILSDLRNFTQVMDFFLQDIKLLSWIDLSFNDLSTIEPVLTSFKDLKVLYLHGNGIPKMSEVDKLAVLPHLQNLTLHGNPIEGEKGYRNYVITVLPHLKNLDFSGVTKQERGMAKLWKRTLSRHGKRTADD